MSFSSNSTGNLSVPTTITTGISAFDVLITTGVLNVSDRYIEISLYSLGVCGALLNIFTFLQKQLRSNSCAIYFLAGSFCDLCTCNIFILSKIVSLFDYHGYLQLSSTSFWCKFTGYCAFMFPCLSSLCITMASIDRVCASSRAAGWRKFSSIKVSRAVILCVFLIWSLFSLHTVIAYDWRKFTTNATTLICIPTQDVYTFFVIIDGFFFALFNGAIVPVFLAFFGILIIHHVQQTQRRKVAVVPIVPIPLAGHNTVPVAISRSPVTLINRVNRHLITMLLVQVFVTIFLTLPYIIFYLNDLYSTETVTPRYLTILYIITWLWYLNYCKTFYVNTLSSQFYRSILKKQVLYLWHRLRAQLMAS